MKKPKIKNLAVYLLILAAVCIMQFFGIAKNAESSVEDSMYQKAGVPNPDIFVIGIDEETLSEYGPFDQWSRTKIAELINVLNEDPKYAPSVIALDIGYYGHKTPDADDPLVEAARNAGNVVVTDSVTIGNVPGKGNVVGILEEPFEELKEVCLGHGYSNTQPDEDGMVRHTTMKLSYNDSSIPSFAVVVYKAFLESKGKEYSEDCIPAYDKSKGFYIAYTGEPGDYYGSVGAGYSLNKVVNKEINAKAFKDAIVFVGAYASGMQDSYYTPIEKARPMAGVEIHANIVDQLIKGNFKQELNLTAAILITVLMGLVVIILVSLIDMKFSFPISIVLGILYTYFTKIGYNKLDILLPIIYPLAAMLLIVITHVIWNYFSVRIEKQRIISNYGKYLSPEVARTIADIGEDSLQLGGTKKDVAILFVDIRSFTTLSESLLPEKVVEMLNSYLSITTKAIFDNEGTVDKFIGDATMGVFNAPLDLPDYTFKAVCAGLEMAELSKNIDESLAEDLRGRVGFGVGINCGDAIVGNIGTSFRMEYTAIGDTVNTASRLEGQAKAGEVIISEAVYNRVKDRIKCESRGAVSLKGKAEPVNIYKALEIIEK